MRTVRTVRARVGPRIFFVCVWVLTYVTPVLAQDVGPNETVGIPGWVWAFGGLAVFFIGFGIALGVMKGDLDRAKDDAKKALADLETYKKDVANNFTEHEKEDRTTYALKVDVDKLASREYVDGLVNSISGKFDLLLLRIEQMKNDMDRQFMFLRESGREGLPRVSPNEDTNPGGVTPTGRQRR